tara:strand:- start:1747 stop:2202 length:456 start_codon:yes stop_codon:yes gene_type:complete
MMSEHWYQNDSISKKDVTDAINTNWFIINLNKNTNTYIDNYRLERYSNVVLTYEEIRRNPMWKTETEKIISQEIDAAEKDGFYSYHSYYCFVHPQLCAIIMRKVIRVVWAIEKIKIKIIRPVRSWLENYYAPYGQGFYKAKTRFYLNSEIL